MEINEQNCTSFGNGSHIMKLWIEKDLRHKRIKETQSENN